MKITEEEIAEYLTKRAQKSASKAAKELNTFVWAKKIERDIIQGATLDAYSIKAEKKRHRERMAEIEKVKKTRTEIANKKSQHREAIAQLARQREPVEEEFENAIEPQQHNATPEKKRLGAVEDAFEKKVFKTMEDMEGGDAIIGPDDEINLDHHVNGRRKPKYSNRVHYGYAWNRYNRTHYDHDNPPPRFVQGYKFNIFYPDLADKGTAPSFSFVEDEGETCIIRFSAGPPYEDVAFRIVSDEWETSAKKGFKNTFDGGILRLYFNFKRYSYRR